VGRDRALGGPQFGARFILQWIVSERHTKSVVPHAFWYLSIGGGIILLTETYAEQLYGWAPRPPAKPRSTLLR